MGAFNDMKLNMALDELVEVKKLLEYASSAILSKGCCGLRKKDWCEWHKRYYQLVGEPKASSKDGSHERD